MNDGSCCTGTSSPDPVATYWRLRLDAVQAALERNNFEVRRVPDRAGAHRLVVEEILPELAPRTVSWGGSLTLASTGLVEALKTRPGLEPVGVERRGLTLEQKLEVSRDALLVDLYLSSTNALTEDGKLVNLDMWGNRVAAITFGPRKVVVLAGRNKIVPDLEAARRRVKEVAAPLNAIRHAGHDPRRRTPCTETGRCQDCRSEQRICNTWTVTEKSFPAGRVCVVLIDEDLGY
jgi:hypothetical protein